MKDVLLKNFATYAEAEAAKDILAQYGIRSVLQKGSSSAMTDFSGYSGDADLFVLEKNLEEAKEILGTE